MGKNLRFSDRAYCDAAMVIDRAVSRMSTSGRTVSITLIFLSVWTGKLTSIWCGPVAFKIRKELRFTVVAKAGSEAESEKGPEFIIKKLSQVFGPPYFTY